MSYKLLKTYIDTVDRQGSWRCSPSLWYLCLLLSDRVSGLHGLAVSLCRPVLKPNTGIRSHLPGMAPIPSTVTVPRCHKTEVAYGVTIEIGAIGRDLRWSLHNFIEGHPVAEGGPQGAALKSTVICLTTVVFALPGEPWATTAAPPPLLLQWVQFQTGRAIEFLL